MTYHLQRLRLHGIIERLPGTHTNRVTSDGIRDAVFYTKVDRRSKRTTPQQPSSFDAPLSTIDRSGEDYVTNARIGLAA